MVDLRIHFSYSYGKGGRYRHYYCTYEVSFKRKSAVRPFPSVTLYIHFPRQSFPNPSPPQ